MLYILPTQIPHFFARHGESLQQLLPQLRQNGVVVEHAQRACNCPDMCGWVLGDVSAGFYYRDVHIWDQVRYQWEASEETTLEEVVLAAVEELVYALAEHQRERLEAVLSVEPPTD